MGRIVEVGIGFNHEVALALTQRLGRTSLRVTDVNDGAVAAARDAGLEALRDDVFRPALELYADANLIYSMRPAPEMLGPLAELARRTRSDLLVFPLSEDAVSLPNTEWLPLKVEGRIVGYGLSQLLADLNPRADPVTATLRSP